MEPQQPQLQQQSQNEDNGKGAVGSPYLSSSSSSCRQSSTRWTPTTDQIRILKELYYNNGIRSPSAEQIQRISARLRQYGKIEGKNVFYWFQNHKARERQKKRFTSDNNNNNNNNMQRGSGTTNNNNGANWKQDQEAIHNKYSNIPTGVSSSSSAGMVTVGQMGNYGYGSVPMEKSFRDCTISAGGSSGHVGAINQNLGLVGVDPYCSTYTAFFDKIIPNGETLEEEEQEEDDDAPEIETLPLFPMHGEDIHGYCSNLNKSNNGYSSNYDGTSWYHHHHQTEDYGFKNGSRASLELSLNSYSRKSPDFA